MSTRRIARRMGQGARGMTLIELVIAIVIIGVAVAGVMLAFTTVVKSSADPMINKQMLAIAEQMMEEVTMKEFTGTAPFGTGTCARDTWIGIQDYYLVSSGVGYDTSKVNCLSSGAAVATPTIYDVTGGAITSLNGYSVAVVLTPAALASTTGTSVNAANAMTITVTVTHGSNKLVLTGWRTNYGS